MNPDFVHLRLHTEYSLIDGILTLPSLIARTADYSMPAIAVTDQSNLYGAVKFYKEAIAAGIKPIIGVDLFVQEEKNKNEIDSFIMTLLCMNNTGYKNLLKIISKSFLEGQISGKPLVKKSWLKEYSSGLIGLSGMESDLGQALLANDCLTAKNILNDWQIIFPGTFYIEISRVGKREEARFIESAAQLAQEFHVPMVATNNVRFLNKEDYEAHEARVCVQEGNILNDPKRIRHYTEQQYLTTPAEMQRLFADIPAAIENTIEIARRCNVTFQLGSNLLPHFEVPEGFTADSYLIQVAKSGLESRLKTIVSEIKNDIAAQRKVYEDRLERELDVIIKMGFAGLFFNCG